MTEPSAPKHNTYSTWQSCLLLMITRPIHATSSYTCCQNTAVVNFRTTAHEQFGDDDIVSEQRRTETWLKQNGEWQLIAIQWNNLPVNFRKPVAIDAKTLKDYLGKYESRPGDDLETVFLKDGKL